LIASARKKNVVDLSVTLSDQHPTTWPGRGVGNHRQPYMTIRFGKNPNTKTSFVMHMMDSHAGTHLVPPACALPRAGFDNGQYAPAVRGWLSEYEKKYGPRGFSDITTEKVPVAETCGPARVIRVKHLIGTTPKGRWPASPEIGVADVQAFEKREGALRPRDVVIFSSGWTDRYYRPGPAGTAFMEAPLNGKSEGWPAPGPETILYLARKGVRCVATDAPSLGGVDEKRALMTYWALGGKNMVGVEMLTNLDALPKGGYFLFAAVKVRDCHGGPGRAIGLY
jgi:kynurenine formamidase